MSEEYGLIIRFEQYFSCYTCTIDYYFFELTLRESIYDSDLSCYGSPK